MYKVLLIFLGSLAILGSGREPFTPHKNSLGFLVYYSSRYRGICVGFLVARSVVMSAAVCVTNPRSAEQDRRPITVVVGTWYRHIRRGFRVPITHIIIPKLPSDDLPYRANLLEKSPAVLMMKWKVADIMAEVPPRAMEVGWKGTERLTLLEECFMAGWHFFYHHDQVYPVEKFLLQRKLRVQFVNLVKIDEWCDALVLRLQKSLHSVGYHGAFDKSDMVCTFDGMYGTPLICQGRAVGIMSAPDAQWTNCTGFSNVVHLFRSLFIHAYMNCVSKLFEPDLAGGNWDQIKKSLYDEEDEYDATHYGKVLSDGSDSSE